MSNSFDDRRKGLEEEYFHRKNQEALDKLREKMKIAAEAKAAGTSSMSCPRCDGKLETSNFEGVEIDTCDKCGGVWRKVWSIARRSSPAGECKELMKSFAHTCPDSSPIARCRRRFKR